MMILIVLLVLLILLSSPESLLGGDPADCRESCGGLNIPYPFGITDGCFREGFRLSCTNISSVRNLYLESDTKHTMPITNISLLTGEVHILHPILSECYDQDRRTASSPFSVNISDTIYTFSDTSNWFTAVGCDTQGYINGTVNNIGSMTPFTVGCISTCYQSESVVDGVCSGIGCCQSRLPKGIKYFEVGFNSYYNHTRVMNFNPCSYVFLVQQDWYKFTPIDISDEFYNEYSDGVPAVLNFSIGTESCNEATRYKSEYACVSRNSDCSNVSSGSGYICSCLPGYEGNPYLKNGCQDIDECKRLGEYPCWEYLHQHPWIIHMHMSTGDQREQPNCISVFACSPKKQVSRRCCCQRRSRGHFRSPATNWKLHFVIPKNERKEEEKAQRDVLPPKQRPVA
ncbi:Wall-associated receptor kinase 2 [Acorus calamus]|uniref:Wall-associated receptor kinase 2 n=1 Tax=Acorus calamus TaxID=4465 RepID=A0AAV9CFH6_ACOCL|nr:Wall-associated receptor kinase 2 [Acorus calamus]